MTDNGSGPRADAVNGRAMEESAALEAAHQSSGVVTKPPLLPRQKQAEQSTTSASTTKQSADGCPEQRVYVDSLGKSMRIKTLRVSPPL